MNKVYENLYIGSSSDAQNEHQLRHEGISTIVNVAKDLQRPWYDGIDSYKVGLLDGPGNNFGSYHRAVYIVDDSLRNGERILIHCHEGRSRSAFVGITAIALDLCRQKIPMEDAIQNAKELVFVARPLCTTMHEYHNRFIPLVIAHLISKDAIFSYGR